jgi:hypothetical protein
VNVDNTPPQLSLSAPGAFCAECGESIDLTYSVQDVGSGVASWQISVDGTPFISGAAGADSTFSWDGSGLGTGDHSLVLRVVPIIILVLREDNENTIVRSSCWLSTFIWMY